MNNSPTTKKDKFIILLATGFGLGYAPIASGTFGTLLGIPIVWLLRLSPCIFFQIMLTGLLVALAIPICSKAEKFFGKKDDGRIVADEFLTFPICMFGLPFAPEVLLLAFLSHRFFDIWKPPPIRNLQKLKGGFGIVIDDFLSSIYSLIFNHLVLNIFACLMHN